MVSQAALSQIVRGNTWPDIPTLEHVGDALGINLFEPLAAHQSASGDRLLDHFAASLSQWSVKHEVVRGERCVVLSNPRPVFVAPPVQGSDTTALHRSIGAVSEGAHALHVQGKILVHSAKPPMATLRMLENLGIETQWQTQISQFDGCLGPGHVGQKL